MAAGLLDDFRRDFHYGMVSLRRNPGFACVAVAVLALGTGANAALFSYVDSVLLGRVAYPEADRLVVIYAVSPKAVSSRLNRLPGVARAGASLRANCSRVAAAVQSHHWTGGSRKNSGRIGVHQLF